MKLSVIIPAHKEPYLQKTIDSLLASSELGSQMEIIVAWDGTEFAEPLDPLVRVVELPRHKGMRAAINAGIEVSLGEFIMKLDAHCAFAQGFDKVMVENCARNWVLYPRSHSLNDETWDRFLQKFEDSFYLQFPVLGKNGYGFSAAICREWKRKIGYGPILDSMAFGGSCWMANKEYFSDCIGFLDDRLTTYGPYHSESAEIALNYWLGDGEVKVVTETWYSHLRKMPRHYAAGLFNRTGKVSVPYTWATKHWMNDEHGKPKPFSWLIDKFWPIPGWPDNWKEIWSDNLARLEGVS